MSDQGDKPKIIVDDDWKEQAQKEKEQLLKAAEAEKETEPTSEAQPEASEQAQADPQDAMPLPPASFSVLITSIATQALAMLGQIPLPDGERVQHLDHAKHHIDTLALLEEKTAGNLEAEEIVMLNNVLHELRMAYVAVYKQGSSSSTAE